MIQMVSSNYTRQAIQCNNMLLTGEYKNIERKPGVLAMQDDADKDMEGKITPVLVFIKRCCLISKVFVETVCTEEFILTLLNIIGK